MMHDRWRSTLISKPYFTCNALSITYYKQELVLAEAGSFDYIQTSTTTSTTRSYTYGHAECMKTRVRLYLTSTVDIWQLS